MIKILKIKILEILKIKRRPRLSQQIAGCARWFINSLCNVFRLRQIKSRSLQTQITFLRKFLSYSRLSNVTGSRGHSYRRYPARCNAMTAPEQCYLLITIQRGIRTVYKRQSRSYWRDLQLQVRKSAVWIVSSIKLLLTGGYPRALLPSVILKAKIEENRFESRRLAPLYISNVMYTYTLCMEGIYVGCMYRRVGILTYSQNRLIRKLSQARALIRPWRKRIKSTRRDGPFPNGSVPEPSYCQLCR